MGEVKKYHVSSEPGKEVYDLLEQYNMTLEDLPEHMMYMVAENSDSFDPSMAEGSPLENSKSLRDYIAENNPEVDRSDAKAPKYFYEIEFEKPGGLVMPLIVEYSYADGSKERMTYPVQIWRKNDAVVRKVLATNKELIGIEVDPDAETADIDTSNNSWPQDTVESEFDRFKSEIKG